jgi:hypothetical protein
VQSHVHNVFRVFLNKAKDLPFSFNKKDFFRSLTNHSHGQSQEKKRKAYSRGIILHNAFAPAWHQSTTSSFILETIMFNVIA